MAPDTPLNKLVLSAASVADDVGYAALADLAHVLGEVTADYRIIGGHMVTMLAARWQLGAELYRETRDVDLGVPLPARHAGPQAALFFEVSLPLVFLTTTASARALGPLFWRPISGYGNEQLAVPWAVIGHAPAVNSAGSGGPWLVSNLFRPPGVLLSTPRPTGAAGRHPPLLLPRRRRSGRHRV